MINAVPPAFLYIIGALILPCVKNHRLKQGLALLIPVLAFVNLLSMPHGTFWTVDFLKYQLILGKVDSLSLVFGFIFVIASFISMLYGIHIKETGQHTAAYLYVGSTLGVVFSGDLFTLFLFWEMMAASSVFLIWYRRTKASQEAGYRYLLVHVTGGCILLAGIVIHVANTGSISFGQMDYHTLAGKFILCGFLINAAVPPLHAWLADAYPESTITGGVFMTAFTTKSAVYVLARGFPGVELLVWLGAIMALYGVVYAVLENDIRRLLAYHIISQVGYMVCGIGLGSEMAINGASAHAFSHILYKAVLFMGMGAVIHVTGCSKMTDLQGRGLYRKMPITLALYMVGAFSISAVPLFNGFISKTMVVAAAGQADRPFIELMLHLASVGTFLHTGLKLPWGTWFGRRNDEADEFTDAREPPLNMLLAMGLGAFLCVLTGVYPKILYDLLPFQVDFHPYQPSHVIGMLQLLLLTAAAFWIFIDKLGGEPFISIDTDWFYRIPARALYRFSENQLAWIRNQTQEQASRLVQKLTWLSRNPYLIIDLIDRPKQLKTGEPDSQSENLEEQTHRQPIGLGALAALIMLCACLYLGLLYQY
ncbi:MAG: Na(+)/H(+) antiporter subunit D [Deltaproteobacteria bacterium]|jgi:multicomponent Na+:H+ antiporter subunit D|nr:Na(+)/H(+) antiporter subunit D [Deltaproteobacteria bacterium]MBT4263355.1 Na(+)/H(+) antiporter subunit D [Deltaproteobacteria bacterium]MBT4639809.1 Na(+)/H(+) antiporter subunit D [Deltaproteobacteria bacterium]MBT6501777.1 Na(+)/H(+) antiporter subunit D [Deltaproteobacteria bacterium]MBT6613419.1 Na(+)/H(+) antiporter subunit D [Deltaproteobacteria bacterium]